MQLSDKWTKVTPFSKVIAMSLFVLLPFVGFFLGTRYQKNITLPSKPVLKTKCPISFCNSAADMKSEMSGEYVDSENEYQFNIPEGWKMVNGSIFSPDYVSNGPDIVQGAVIYIYSTDEYRSLDEIVKDSKEDILNVPVNPRFVTVDGIKAYQIVLGHEGLGTFTDVIYKGKRYSIDLSYSYNQNDISTYLKTYNELLKSFKFIQEQ